MMRSLWTAATGMNGQQFNINTISNNLSNVNTTGYKQVRADFEDLIYLNSRIAGTPATERTVTPTGVQVGHGVKIGASQRIFTQGSLRQTDALGDIAVMGEGFFRVLNMDGTYAYTRDGSFKIDSNGQFVSSNGYRLMPELVLPVNFIPETLSVSQQGRVTVKIPDQDDPIAVGQIDLYRFVNPAGLHAAGENLFVETAASGEAARGRPGTDDMGKVLHKFLENSNVSVVKEMVGMIVAQRAYELNSKAIQTSDTMLGIANNLKRG
ncbi:MAG: flagellar basal-body rod protein FlgG [Spirochaeta sp. LUC14_002_19_P3]|nr:MAG: flagellar basal-body rod protein FlgG [Spirochaeta sp. LUC14_002_19_P3]